MHHLVSAGDCGCHSRGEVSASESEYNVSFMDTLIVFHEKYEKMRLHKIHLQYNIIVSKTCHCLHKQSKKCFMRNLYNKYVCKLTLYNFCLYKVNRGQNLYTGVHCPRYTVYVARKIKTEYENLKCSKEC